MVTLSPPEFPDKSVSETSVTVILFVTPGNGVLCPRDLVVKDWQLTVLAWHIVEPAASEYLPASQSVHSALPVPALNLPAAQSSHASPSGPVEPALHTHAVAAALEVECGGHCVHGSLPEVDL